MCVCVFMLTTGSVHHYKQALMLYILGSVANTLQECSFSAAVCEPHATITPDYAYHFTLYIATLSRLLDHNSIVEGTESQCSLG